MESCGSRAYAARSLVESAVRSWRSKYPTSKVDDCAVVCLFLDSNECWKENIDENGEIDGNVEVGHEWSALEGVSRVNTLLTLPRFVPGKDDIKANANANAT